MSVPRSVAEVLAEHVTLEVEGIDRMYLNVYIPGLQREQGVACFFRFHRGHQFASSALMDPISKTFVAALEAFARQEKIPVIPFRKGQRKHDVAAEQRKKFQKTEGVVFIGKAQEKTPVFRAERRRSETTGGTYPWLVRSRPTEVDGQRASALRFGDPRVQTLFAVLVVFSLPLRGVTNSEMRVLLGLDPANYPPGKLT